MRNILRIILFFIMFSIASTSFAYQTFDDVFGFEASPEQLELQITPINKIKFSNSQHKSQYLAFIRMDQKIRKVIGTMYKKEKLEYYKVHDFINNYNMFIYYGNEYFFYIRAQEVYGKSKYFEKQAYKNITLAREFYNKIKYTF